MLEVADFISKYYVCSMGQSLTIFQFFNKNIEYENKIIEFKKR